MHLYSYFYWVFHILYAFRIHVRYAFVNISFQCKAYLFILSTVSFEEDKVLVLMRSEVSIFSFIDYGFGVISKKYAQPKFVKNLFYVFLKKCCFESLFRSLIYWYVVWGIDFDSSIIFCIWVSSFPTPFVEKTVLSLVNCFFTFVENHLPV